MRPRQWTKNGFIWAALFFDIKLLDVIPFLRTLAGFFIFCLLSSTVYIINDISDIEADRNHPEKRFRPLASGALPVPVAVAAAIIFILIIFPVAYWLAPSFALICGIYLAINLAYSSFLKHIPIIDVLVIAAGFVLRVAAGVTLISVERFSPWLYVLMTLLALYLGFGKRRAELALLADGSNSHRRVLQGYTIPLLDQFITIVSGTTIVAYSLYTFSAPNLPQNHLMMITIPIVLYAIFRYLYLIQVKHSGGAPEDLLINDRPLQIAILLWALTIFIILYVIGFSTIH